MIKKVSRKLFVVIVIFISMMMLLADNESNSLSVEGGTNNIDNKLSYQKFVNVYYMFANAISPWKILSGNVSPSGKWVINVTQQSAGGQGQADSTTPTAELFNVHIGGTITKDGGSGGSAPRFDVYGQHTGTLALEQDKQYIAKGSQASFSLKENASAVSTAYWKCYLSSENEPSSWTSGSGTISLPATDAPAGIYTIKVRRDSINDKDAKNATITVVDVKFDPSPVDFIIKGATAVPVEVTVTPSSASSSIAFIASNSNITVSGSASNLTVTGVSSGNSEVIAKIGQIEIKRLSASVITNSPLTTNNVSIALGATPIHYPTLGSGVWGYCDTETVDITIIVGRSGNQWVPIVTTLKGNYSLRARLLSGVSEVTGPPPAGNSSQLNWKSQIADLNRLSPYKGAWYMLSAIDAHENVHATRLLPALQTTSVMSGIKSSIEGNSSFKISSKGRTAPEAISNITGKSSFKDEQKNGARSIWDARYVTLISGDHGANYNGPAYQAEKNIITPMVNAINTHANANNW